MIAEVCYSLNKHGGADVEAVPFDAVSDGTFTLVELINDVQQLPEPRSNVPLLPLRPQARLSTEVRPSSETSISIGGRCGDEPIACFE